MNTHETDVLIIGAGISGVSAAHHLREHCPDKNFTILEGRGDIGGTWDLFRYPGIRSDSDMFTLGFSFRPWNAKKMIADAPSIMSYLRETIKEEEIEKHIQFNKKVKRAAWSSAENMWTLEVEDKAAGVVETHKARFIHLCTGYYNYDEGYRPHFEGEENFSGKIIHPQFWDEKLDYKDKKVVVIGSGATAVTLIPEMAEEVEHITMLQRSPTYIVSMPGESKWANRLRKYLPAKLAYAITRWQHILLQRFMFWFARTYPERAKKQMLELARAQVPADFDFEKHLVPYYQPWDQRVCLAPDGDFFESLSSGKASITTDHIANFDANGIALKSGERLDADIIITATGIDVVFFGQIDIEVDGQEVYSGDLTSYKGIMFSGVPNFALSTGYTNASWTLKCDLTSTYVSRILNHMDKHGYEKAVAIADNITATPVFDLSSGYMQRKADQMPKQGEKAPWRLYHNYLIDLFMLRWGGLHDDSIKFTSERKPEAVVEKKELPLAAE